MTSPGIINAYVRKIIRALEENPENPAYTIDDVPARVRDEVRAALEELGY